VLLAADEVARILHRLVRHFAIELHRLRIGKRGEERLGILHLNLA
jgi:hypothetical protein